MKEIGELAKKYESLSTKITETFYGSPKALKLKQINEAIQQQESEYIAIHGSHDSTVRPLVGELNFPTTPLRELVNIILKLFFNSHKKLC